MVDNSGTGAKAFDNKVENDPQTGLPKSSSAEKKLGVYAADTAYVDFINLLMHPNPAHRLTPQQALKHPFMRQRMLDDEAAKALIKGVVAPPPAEDDTPLAKQTAALAKATKAAAAATEDATDRAGKLG